MLKDRSTIHEYDQARPKNITPIILTVSHPPPPPQQFSFIQKELSIFEIKPNKNRASNKSFNNRSKHAESMEDLARERAEINKPLEEVPEFI
jgi:hypothetical protein